MEPKCLDKKVKRQYSDYIHKGVFNAKLVAGWGVSMITGPKTAKLLSSKLDNKIITYVGSALADGIGDIGTITLLTYIEKKQQYYSNNIPFLEDMKSFGASKLVAGLIYSGVRVGLKIYLSKKGYDEETATFYAQIGAMGIYLLAMNSIRHAFNPNKKYNTKLVP